MGSDLPQSPPPTFFEALDRSPTSRSNLSTQMEKKIPQALWDGLSMPRPAHTRSFSMVSVGQVLRPCRAQTRCTRWPSCCTQSLSCHAGGPPVGLAAQLTMLHTPRCPSLVSMVCCRALVGLVLGCRCRSHTSLDCQLALCPRSAAAACAGYPLHRSAARAGRVVGALLCAP